MSQRQRLKRYVLPDYEVMADFSPAKDLIGDFEVIIAPHGEVKNGLTMASKETGKFYLRLIIMELSACGSENQYPDAVNKILEDLEFEKPLMFWETHNGKNGLFAIAQKKADKTWWFYYTACPFARFGMIEGTNFSLSSGLSIFITTKILDSIRIRKLV